MDYLPLIVVPIMFYCLSNPINPNRLPLVICFSTLSVMMILTMYLFIEILK